MRCVDNELRIYIFCFDELPIRVVNDVLASFDRNFDGTLGETSMYYDEKSDKIMINQNFKRCDEEIKFIKKIMSLNNIEEYNEALRNEGTNLRKTEMRILRIAFRKRQMKKRDTSRELDIKPNVKFLEISGNLFQISKIISVKISCEHGKYFLNVNMTSRCASIKKEFPSKEEANRELNRINDILLSA